MSIDNLQKMIDTAKRIVFFGGAGVSTESGISDYRSENGLYRQKFDYPPEMMLSHDFFVEHPEEFYRFYRERMLSPDAKPNAAHLKLAELEQAGKLIAVITQNVDGLHYAAGSKNVCELHGSSYRNRCTVCGAEYDGLERILSTDGLPLCDCGGLIRPQVVLYGEAPDSDTMDRALSAIVAADMLIIGGTSLSVYPAASLIRYFHGKYIAVINREPCYTLMRMTGYLEINDSIGEVLSRIHV